MPIAKQNATDYKPVSSGTQFGRCFGVVSLGTQPSDNPKFKPSKKVLMLFELPNETYELDGKQVPMSIVKEYTLSINKKANLRKDLDSWRGRPFTEQEAQGFPVENVIDAPCMLSIAHYQKRDGSTGAKIASIAGVPKGMSVPALSRDKLHYEIEQGENEVFQKLPDWLKDKIGKCLEWNPDTQVAAPSEPEPQHDDGGEDSVPFAWVLPWLAPITAAAAGFLS